MIKNKSIGKRSSRVYRLDFQIAVSRTIQN